MLNTQVYKYMLTLYVWKYVWFLCQNYNFLMKGKFELRLIEIDVFWTININYHRCNSNYIIWCYIYSGKFSSDYIYVYTGSVMYNDIIERNQSDHQYWLKNTIKFHFNWKLTVYFYSRKCWKSEKTIYYFKYDFLKSD